MKTQLFLSAAFLMLFSTATIASSSSNNIILYNSFGKALSMPAITEEAEEGNFPFDIESIFHETRKKELERNFDFTEMIKTETEVNDIPEKDLEKLGLK